ncbi:unnamed protein product [Phytophthora fragariaefolia]|uniref:Unnamed protein product n=1 Tax=Phytophthora fragariaefolia TaxID=1490495 RepID=A0A9W6X8S7_9STRA|nr:unnamed protein product [Phytophthora fragariaefolia]
MLMCYQPPSQLEINAKVRELVHQELPHIKECHARRVRHILRDTRKQVDEYLKAHQVLRGEQYRRLQWSELASNERVTAKRVLQNPTRTVQPYNSLVGDVRYFVQHHDQPLESLVYPETVNYLPNDITAIRRSFTMIGIRKNVYVEGDTILRYIPYLGDGEHMVIDNDRYTETTMSKERQVTVFGEGEELKISSPDARDDEIMEYLLRIIVGICGTSEQVFLALQHETEFAKPFIDYREMQKTYKQEQRTASRIAKLRRLLASHHESFKDTSSNSVKQKYRFIALRKLAHPHWFLRDKPEPRSLAVRLQPPLTAFESTYAESPEGLGIRDCTTCEGLIECYRDLFCRRCYSYDCFEHGIENPQRSLRADPINPMVTAPGIVLARREIPVREDIGGVEDGSPNSSTSPTDHPDIIELTGSSSSEDEVQESRTQQCNGTGCESQPTSVYRRSRRAQTRISSLASRSLQSQEKMLETERLAELEKRRKRREKFERAADNSEYLDNSYLPEVTAKLQNLVSKTKPCSSSCWLSISNDNLPEKRTSLRKVESLLVQKLASTFGPNSCVLSTMLKSPRCTCAQIYRILADEKKRRDSGDELGTESEMLMPSNRRRKGRQDTRVRSNRSLSKRDREKRSYDREKKMSYKPCDHDGPIRKDEFVLEYTGELISDDEAERRGAIYDRQLVSYLFGVNSEYVVDAARKGNKAKFANHKAKEEANLDVKIIASNGEHRIGLFAREAIEVGAELFFDYGYTHDTAPKWSQHDKPEPEKRVYDIVDDENEWE